MKIIRWIVSLCRLICYKLIYGKKFKFEIFPKPVYLGKAVKLKISKNAMICLKSGVYVSDYSLLEAIDGEIIIGEGTFLNRFVTIVSRNSIDIGKYCMLANNVSIYDHDHGYNEKEIYIKQQNYVIGKVKINDDVWLAAGVVCLKNAVIGKHCVVGANSVIKGSLKEQSIYSGNPIERVKDI